MFTGLLSHSPDQLPNRLRGDTTQQPFYFPVSSHPKGQTMSDCFQQSRAILLAIPVMLLVVQVCSIPVSAANIDISVSGDISHMALTTGSSNQNSSVHLNVTSDTATLDCFRERRHGWIQKSLAFREGKMANWYGICLCFDETCSSALQDCGDGCDCHWFQRIVCNVTVPDQPIETGLH